MDIAAQKAFGRIGGLVTRSRHADPPARAREAFERRFLDEVDAERVLPEAERARRALAARRAYFARLTAASIAARKRKAAPPIVTRGAAKPAAIDADRHKPTRSRRRESPSG